MSPPCQCIKKRLRTTVPSDRPWRQRLYKKAEARVVELSFGCSRKRSPTRDPMDCIDRGLTAFRKGRAAQDTFGQHEGQAELISSPIDECLVIVQLLGRRIKR